MAEQNPPATPPPTPTENEEDSVHDNKPGPISCHGDPFCECLYQDEKEEEMNSKSVARFALSLSGCGFLGVYHFGAIHCFQKHGRKFLEKCDRFAGASAGSLVAAVMVTCPDKIQDCLTAWYSLADEVIQKPFGALTTDYSLIKRVEEYVESIMPVDAHKLANGRLFISVTCNADNKNCIVSEYESRESLLKYLVGSCYIPFYAGAVTPPLIGGKEWVDGGLSTNLPKFVDRRTITISPFSGEADISPEDGWAIFDWSVTLANQTVKLNLGNMKRGMQALFPPSMQVLEDYYKLGYMDTMKFLMKHRSFERDEGSSI